MFDTYQMMTKYASKQYAKENMNNLAFRFRNTTDKIEKNKIYATLFVNLFPMMLKLQRTHLDIPNEEKVEICMEKLLTALKSFDHTKVKFSTYYHQCLSNQLLSQDTKQRCTKRKVWRRVISDELKTDNAFKKIKSPISKDLKLIEKLKDSDLLTTTEKEYCACILAGYSTQKELQEKLKLAERMKNITVDNPIYNSVNSRLVNEVKNSLKQKLKECLIEL